MRKIKEQLCYTEVATSKARLDYDVNSFAANKLVKDAVNKGMGRMADGKDDSAGQNNSNDF